MRRKLHFHELLFLLVLFNSLLEEKKYVICAREETALDSEREERKEHAKKAKNEKTTSKTSSKRFFSISLCFFFVSYSFFVLKRKHLPVVCLRACVCVLFNFFFLLMAHHAIKHTRKGAASHSLVLLLFLFLPSHFFVSGVPVLFFLPSRTAPNLQRGRKKVALPYAKATRAIFFVVHAAHIQFGCVIQYLSIYVYSEWPKGK
ncbi:hypothetical protein ABB37_07509 [Leptomonas pyrrhocoris]|uniref:Transmembrane protein n=1 Tax=Leptomonas pyrrhocoris TaxID=157538 RepID=A0A0M9FV90_LEPPY|nr:hypothetical protein ABB37_07509 [Leptomonas pyrrhocoris]KPA76657.1 hypothetical protein ABB37_07509 [Leptomonas pyrrhocoris]|eukprot:XP_015655096.1 hypothetical protein ABB37_07509 [Leptomonas pyrrhocoris]